jgi:rhodanese-related sulfurtransferase
MDQSRFSISPGSLYSRLVTALAPLVIDVRKASAFDADDTMIVGAVRRAPNEIDRWRQDLPSERFVVAYCVHGQDVSQGVAATLRASGVDAAYLEGGITGWTEQKLPMRRKLGAAPGKWVIRGVNVKVASNEWHTLGLNAEGDRFTVSFDGKQLFTATDKTFADSGKVALWTKADSITHFDRLEIRPLQ